MARVAWILGGIWLMLAPVDAQEPIPIGQRLELFVEDTLIARLTGGARLVLHRPIPREIVFVTDAPWEGNACGYPSVVRDGATIRLYYHGLHYATGGPEAAAKPEHPPVYCFAESQDGIHFVRPHLGVCEWAGSKENNIVLTPAEVTAIGGDPAHTATFLDGNPQCPPAQRYKTIIVGKGGLYCLVSPDGVHWKPLSDQPVVTEGAFDSQNLAFWDPVHGVYREYHRGFREGVRDILTATSPDIRHFPKPQWLSYPGAPKEHLYTNQIMPYSRAPQILIGFPMRYTDYGWLDPLFDLPGLRERMARAQAHPRYGTAITDAVFMASRDGVTFKRWPEAFIRPGPATKGAWVYGDNMIAWGMAETPSALPGAPPELSFYVTEHYWEGTWMAFRRYTLRLDGFVSVQAPLAGGELLTRPLIFEGGNLALNMETSGAGGVQVEIQDAEGRPVPGFSLVNCPLIRGDTVRHIVRWKTKGGDLRPLAGRPIRLRFVLRDADLYALQFVPYTPDPQRPAVPPPK